MKKIILIVIAFTFYSLPSLARIPDIDCVLSLDGIHTFLSTEIGEGFGGTVALHQWWDYLNPNGSVHDLVLAYRSVKRASLTELEPDTFTMDLWWAPQIGKSYSLGHKQVDLLTSQPHGLIDEKLEAVIPTGQHISWTCKSITSQLKAELPQ